MTHYEFYAVIDPLEEKLGEVYHKLEDMEERLVETRAKHLLMDLFITGTGRFILIILSLITAYVLSRFGYNPFR